jgi:rod shape-determining protein MreC
MQSLNYKKKRSPRLLIGIFVLVVLVACLNFFSQGVRNFFYSVSSPVQKILWTAGSDTSNFFGALLQINNFANNTRRFDQQNQELMQQKMVDDNLSAENQVLRQALGLGLEKDFSMAFTQVIQKDIFSDSILVNKGSADGIEKNMAVINQQKILFGKISEVYKNFSKVSLITDKDFAVDATVQDKTAYGVVKGNGNSGADFELVSKSAGLQDGDTLLTSALGGDFPKGLLIGQVQNIKSEDTKPFNSAEIKPLFDLDNTETLFIVTDFKGK